MNFREVQLQPQRWDVAPTSIQSRRAARAQNLRTACLSSYFRGAAAGEVGLGETMAELAVPRGNFARRALFSFAARGE